MLWQYDFPSCTEFRLLSGTHLGGRGIQSMEGSLQVTTGLSLVTGWLFGTNHVDQESLELEAGDGSRNGISKGKQDHR